MGNMITGFTATTAEKLLLGAGAFFKNYEIATDTPATAAAKLIGATQGGGSFSAIPTVRKIEVDGAKTNTKGLQTIDEWVVTLTSNVKEVSVDSIVLALGAATSSAAAAPTDYTKIVGNEDFKDEDYLDNLTWVGTLSGSTTPVIIIVKNALSVNGLTITVEDKNEAVVPIVVTGNYEATDLQTAPFEIYYPTVA